MIQHRLKRSGQRWPKVGAQRIVQLRVSKKSNRWNKVISIAQYAKMAAYGKVSCTRWPLRSISVEHQKPAALIKLAIKGRIRLFI